MTIINVTFQMPTTIELIKSNKKTNQLHVPQLELVSLLSPYNCPSELDLFD